MLLVHAQGPGSWRVSESLLDRTHSNNYFPSCGSAALSLSVSRTRCLTISLISHARLTLGSRPPALPLLPYALSHLRYLTCGGSPSCSLMLSSRDSRRLAHAQSAHARSRPPANPPSGSYRTLCLISHMRRIPPSCSLMLSSRDSRPRRALTRFPCSCALRCALSLSCALLLSALTSNPGREPAQVQPEVQQCASYSPQRSHRVAEI